MAQISMYDLAMLIWLDEMPWDVMDVIHHLLVRGIRSQLFQ